MFLAVHPRILDNIQYLLAEGVSGHAEKGTRSDIRHSAAREKLKPSGKPYYRAIGPDVHLGYRKGRDARKWVVRIYSGSGQYVTETIGHADDIADADGINVLSFWQAQEKARDLLAAKSAAAPSRRGYTVSDAIAAYLDILAINLSLSARRGYVSPLMSLRSSLRSSLRN